MRERAEALAKEAYERRTLSLAEDLIVQANKGDAVLGLDATLEALQNGSVYQLFFTEDYTLPENRVRRCAHCNYLTMADVEVCPLCGGEMRPMVDAINNIARRAIAQGASVFVLAPDNPLENNDAHIGAFLRY